MRQWFQIVAKADEPAVADIHIIDVIAGWDEDWIARNFGYDMGVTARGFVEQLASLNDGVKTIHVHINSPGGDVFAAANIANALREQRVSKGRTVETFIDGIAASAASVIAMAGSKVHMADNGLMMIHDPWSRTVGNAAEMRKAADVLDTIRNTIVATYKWHSSLDDEAIVALMAAETWMSADEALVLGFVTDKMAGLKASNSIDKRSIAALKVPDQFKARVDALLKTDPAPPKAAAATEVLRICAEAGCDVAFASAMVAENLTLEQAQSRAAADKQRRADAAARETSIQMLCANSKVPQLAAGYIAGGMSVDQVKAHLVTVTAIRDNVEIDGGLNPDAGQRSANSLSASAIYAKRNAQARN